MVRSGSFLDKLATASLFVTITLTAKFTVNFGLLTHKERPTAFISII